MPLHSTWISASTTCCSHVLHQQLLKASHSMRMCSLRPANPTSTVPMDTTTTTTFLAMVATEAAILVMEHLLSIVQVHHRTPPIVVITPPSPTTTPVDMAQVPSHTPSPRRPSVHLTTIAIVAPVPAQPSTNPFIVQRNMTDDEWYTGPTRPASPSTSSTTWQEVYDGHTRVPFGLTLPPTSSSHSLHCQLPTEDAFDPDGHDPSLDSSSSPPSITIPFQPSILPELPSPQQSLPASSNAAAHRIYAEPLHVTIRRRRHLASTNSQPEHRG